MKMALYCLITNSQRTKYAIVPTTNVFELNEENTLVKVQLQKYQSDDKCYVRGATIKLGNGAFYIMDSDDNYSVLTKRNPVDARIIVSKLPEYSPSLQSKGPKKTTTKTNTLVDSRSNSVFNSVDYYRNKVPGRSSTCRERTESQEQVLNESGLDEENSPTAINNSGQHAFRTPRPRRSTLIRRSSKSVQQLNQIQKTLNKINRIEKQNKNTGDHSQQPPSRQRQQNTRIPNFEEKNTVVNDVEIIEIGAIKFTATEFSKIILKRKMVNRAKAMINKLWSSDELLHMYVKRPKNDATSVPISDAHCLQLKDMCLYLQQRREIKYWENFEDNIDFHVQKWIGDFCNERRRKVKNSIELD